MRVSPTTFRINALYLAFFVVGYAAIVSQVVLTREFLVVLNGNELCIGLILASWLLGIGIGAWAGATIADRIRAVRGLFLVCLVAMAAALPLQIAAIRGARGILGIGVGEAIPLLAMLVFCPPVTALTSLLVGFIFPFAGRLSAESRGEEVTGVADLYMVESAGSLVGGLLFTFALVELLQPLQVALLSAAVLAVGGFAVALTIERSTRRNVTTGLFVVLVTVAGLAIPDIAVRWDRELELLRWKQTAADIPLVASADSRYQHLSVGGYDGQYSLYTNGSVAGYAPADYSHAQLTHFLLSQHPRPRRILLIGSGTEGVLPTLAKYHLERTDYILQDDRVLDVMAPFKSEQQLKALREAVTLHVGDGRRFLLGTRQTYDMVIALVPPPANAMLNRYYTEEFFRLARERLNPGGVFIIPLPMTPNYIGGAVGSFVGSIHKALSNSFPEIVYSILPRDFAICALSPGVVTADTEELARRWQSREIDDATFHEVLFSHWLDPERVNWRRAEIEALPPAGGNFDLQPAAYLYRLLIWNRTSGEDHGIADGINAAILTLRGLSIWPPLAAIAMFLAASLAIRRLLRRPPERFIGLAVIASTGFTAMAVEILLIFAYQNLFGYIYHEIGLIVAVFMAGLALGAWWMRRAPAGKADKLRGLFLKLEVGVLAVSLLVPFVVGLGGQFLAGAPGGRFAMIGLLGLAGVLTGAEFPLAVALTLRSRPGKVGAGAGAVDAADHLGAAFGAGITGVLLVPIVGFWMTAILLVCLKIASLVLVLRN